VFHASLKAVFIVRMEVKLDPSDASTLREAIDATLLEQWPTYMKKLVEKENVTNLEKQRKILESFSNRAFDAGLNMYADEVSIKVKKEDADTIRAFLQVVLTNAYKNDKPVIQSVIDQLGKTSGGRRKTRKNRKALSRKRKN
jgi:hypothetical protein